MAARRVVGNRLALAVLSYLSQRPMHPYELSRTLRENGDQRSIKFNHGSLYMVVQQLTRAGFIVEVDTRREGQRPERTVYALTDAGRVELRDWLRDLLAEPRHEYPEFVAALSLIGTLRPDEVVELLSGRLVRLAEQRAEIQQGIDRAVAQGVHPLFLIEEEYRRGQLEAEVSFVERLRDRITDPDHGWAPQWLRFHQAAADAGETTD